MEASQPPLAGWAAANAHTDRVHFLSRPCVDTSAWHLAPLIPSRPCHRHSLLVVQAGEHIDIAVLAPEGIQRDRQLGGRGAGGFLGKEGLTLLLQGILGCPQGLKFLCCFLAHQMGAESPNVVITGLLRKGASLRGGFCCGAKGAVEPSHEVPSLGAQPQPDGGCLGMAGCGEERWKRATCLSPSFCPGWVNAHG